MIFLVAYGALSHRREELRMFQVIATSSAANTFVGALAGIATLGMMILAWVTWADKRARESAAALAAAEAEKTENQKEIKMDLLTAGQVSIQNALARADEENAGLREQLSRLRRRHDEAQRGWQKRFEAQEDEIIILKAQCAACTEECKLLRVQLTEGQK